MNYDKDLAIDPHNLAEEWLQQPNLYMKYSELAAEAKKKLQLMHEDLKVKRSELVKYAKDNPDKLPGGKSNDSTVEAYYRDHPAHKKLYAELIEQEFTVNLLDAAVQAFNQRKVALENLVRLWAAQYFAGPKEPIDLPEGKRWRPEEEKVAKTSATQRANLKGGFTRRR